MGTSCCSGIWLQGRRDAHCMCAKAACKPCYALHVAVQMELIKLHVQLGSQWSRIARNLGHRTENMVGFAWLFPCSCMPGSGVLLLCSPDIS